MTNTNDKIVLPKEPKRGGETMEEKGEYPKLQWSVFVKNGKDTQYVVRADTIEEFKELKKFVLQQVGEDMIASGQNVSKPQLDKTEGLRKCAECGAVAEDRRGTSKTGKPWHGYFCTADKNHVQWLKS